VLFCVSDESFNCIETLIDVMRLKCLFVGFVPEATNPARNTRGKTRRSIWTEMELVVGGNSGWERVTGRGRKKITYAYDVDSVS
jgi:hypothetical protein